MLKARHDRVSPIEGGVISTTNDASVEEAVSRGRPVRKQSRRRWCKCNNAGPEVCSFFLIVLLIVPAFVFSFSLLFALPLWKIECDMNGRPACAIDIAAAQEAQVAASTGATGATGGHGHGHGRLLSEAAPACADPCNYKVSQPC